MKSSHKCKSTLRMGVSSESKGQVQRPKGVSALSTYQVKEWGGKGRDISGTVIPTTFLSPLWRKKIITRFFFKVFQPFLFLSPKPANHYIHKYNLWSDRPNFKILLRNSYQCYDLLSEHSKFFPCHSLQRHVFLLPIFGSYRSRYLGRWLLFSTNPSEHFENPRAMGQKPKSHIWSQPTFVIKVILEWSHAHSFNFSRFLSPCKT